MMSIMIKGMEMPKTCKECPFSDHEAWCLISGDWRERYYMPKDERSKYCPLIELPSHGRLIDADRLLTDRMKSKYYHLPNGDIAIPIIDIEHAPTVIEAEDKEE